MSDEKSVFSGEWRRCMREHYKYVIRSDDRLTRLSLEPVMERIGFGEDELKALRVEATMRVEDVADDFVPELDILEQKQPADTLENPAHPLECQCPACVEINRIPHDEEGQPLDDEARAELEAELAERAGDDADAPPDADAPQQLSMF